MTKGDYGRLLSIQSTDSSFKLRHSVMFCDKKVCAQELCFVKLKAKQSGVKLMSGQGSGGNVLAALCSVFVPGLGQLLQGRLFAAILFCAITLVGYALWWLVIPAIIGAIAHLCAVLDAARFRSYR